MNIYRKKKGHKIKITSGNNADFGAVNEIHNSNKRDKTTNISKQNPVRIGSNIVSELNDVFQSGYYESLVKKVGWFVDEVIKIGNRMNFFFKNI